MSKAKPKSTSPRAKSALPVAARGRLETALSGDANHRTLVLVKEGKRYVFHYDVGGERELLQSFLDMVADGQSGLEWYDAAMLCNQMGEGMGRELEKLKSA